MDNVVNIRPFALADRAAVVNLWRLVFAEDPPWNEPNLVIDTKLTVQPHLFFVAELEGEVVGTTVAGFDGVRGWVHHVAVHPDAQRKGIASLLMTAAEAGLRKMGCQKLNLQVRASNTSVLEFYEELGFQKEDRISFGKRLE
tara:strand:+ start:4167 stop:4592 length:426 start_codon:yes stop_codon:yes gene_type:complete